MQAELASQPTLTTAPADAAIPLVEVAPAIYTLELAVAEPETAPVTVAEMVDVADAEIIALEETRAQLLMVLVAEAEVVNLPLEPKLAPARKTFELPLALSVHGAAFAGEKSGPWMHTAALAEAVTPSVPDVAASALVTKSCEPAAVATMLPTPAVNN